MISAIACIGGVLVLIGLCMEKSAEKPLYRDVTDMRRQKSKTKWGWWILITGIGIEILTAAGLSGYDVWERRQATSRIESIDPMNQLVRDATASVHFTLSEKFDLPIMLPEYGKNCMLFFSRHGDQALPGVIMLQGKEAEVYGWDCFVRFSPILNSNFTTPYQIAEHLTVRQLLDSIEKCLFMGSFKPPHLGTNSISEADVVAGDVTLTLNYSVPKIFVLPRQNFALPAMLSFAGFVSDTNGVPIIPKGFRR
jgi:hypothetical protein